MAAGQDAYIDDDLWDALPEDGSAVWRLWHTERCLVVPATEGRLPSFAAAAAQSAELGWPIRQRRSGGLAVPNGPGLLNLSIAQSVAGSPSIEYGYQLLYRVLAGSLAEFGVMSELGAVAGSFCDGRHNIVVHDRKLAGTAQRWRLVNGGTRTAILAHAVILVDLEVAPAIAALEAYYRALGRPQHFLESATLTLAALGIDGSVFETALRHRLDREVGSSVSTRQNGTPTVG